MANSVRELITELEGIPPDLKKKLRPALRRAANPIVADARKRASWSTRIPPATRVSTSFQARKAGVSIVVDRKKAPHARPYENLGQPGIFRHPVYGNYENWVSQRARPFLFPAVFANSETVVKAIDRAVNATAEEHGFH